MKKFTLYVAGLLAVLTLVSCHAPSSQPLQSQPSESAPAQTGFWADPGEPLQGTTLSGEEGEIPSTNIYSLEEYEAYLESVELPENFVRYEDLSAFGSFVDFICVEDPTSVWFTYNYTIKDENGEKFFFTIRRNRVETDKIATRNYLTGDKLLSDARFIDEEGACWVQWQGIEWYYRNEKLFYMYFYYDGLEISVTGDQNYLGDYEFTSTPTFMSRLLTKSEAPYALSELAAALTAEKQAEG